MDFRSTLMPFISISISPISSHACGIRDTVARKGHEITFYSTQFSGMIAKQA